MRFRSPKLTQRGGRWRNVCEKGWQTVELSSKAEEILWEVGVRAKNRRVCVKGIPPEVNYINERDAWDIADALVLGEEPY